MKVASARGWTPVPRYRKFTGRNRYRPVPANVPRFPGSRRIRDEPLRRIRSRCVIQNLSKRSRARAGRTQRDHGARCDPYPPAYSSKSPLRLRRPATQFCESSRGVFNIHWQVSAPGFLYRRHPAGSFAAAPSDYSNHSSLAFGVENLEIVQCRYRRSSDSAVSNERATRILGDSQLKSME